MRRSDPARPCVTAARSAKISTIASTENTSTAARSTIPTCRPTTAGTRGASASAAIGTWTAQDTLTVQGDHYVGTNGQDTVRTLTEPPYSVLQQGQTHNTGENVLARLHHVCNEDSDWSLQMYYDNFQRGTVLNSEAVQTFDIDFQYRFPLGDRQQITCGAGYRYIHYKAYSDDVFTIGVIPPEGSPYVVSQFIQDEIALAPDLLALTLGLQARGEHVHLFRVPAHGAPVVDSRPKALGVGRRIARRAHAEPD